MYEVIKYFTDLQDNKYAYNVGDKFPRDGMTVTPERLAQLASNKNRQGKPLIKEITVEDPVDQIVEEAPKPKSSRKKRAE